MTLRLFSSYIWLVFGLIPSELLQRFIFSFFLDFRHSQPAFEWNKDIFQGLL